MKKNKLVSVVTVTLDRREDVIECVESYLKNSYKPIEIIVVDNNSKPSLKTWFPKKYPQVKLISEKKDTGAALGRNIGLSYAKGDYVVFTDDDAYADRNMVKNLVMAFDKKPKAGIIQPLVYDKKEKDVLQGAGHDINLTTGRIKAWGVGEKDEGQYNGIREIPMSGCVWMVKREVFEKIGNYDENYFILYEDCDFSIRARKAGFKIYCTSDAKTWHRASYKKSSDHPFIRWLGITSPERAERVARNKLIFMRKHSPFFSFLFFFFILMPFYTLAHSIIIASVGRFDVLKNYWKGLSLGISWVINSFWLSINFFLLSWTDPVGWVIIKNPRRLLDLGCGWGKLMVMLKMRNHIGKSVGVDIFEPDLMKARKKGIYDSLILQDIRDISFPRKSFDVVLVNHVLEHLNKKQALNLIDKIEKIAKKEVIISTPVGLIESPDFSENKYQLHKSYFTPEDLERRGYKVVKFGWRWLLPPTGLAGKTKSNLMLKFYYLLHFLFIPLYYLFPETCDYSFTAYKNL